MKLTKTILAMTALLLTVGCYAPTAEGAAKYRGSRTEAFVDAAFPKKFRPTPGSVHRVTVNGRTTLVTVD